MKKPPVTKNSNLEIPGLRMEQATFHIVGTSPLIQKRISDDTIDDLRRKNEGLPKLKRSPKSEKQMFEESSYRTKRGYGHPAAGFKNCIVEGNRDSKTMSKRIISKWFFIVGDPETGLVPIQGKPIARTDNFRCRAGLGSVTRAFYPMWSAELVIQFDANKISHTQLIQFLNTAGAISGIGCWRPSAPTTPGDYGRFKVQKISKHTQIS